MRRAQRALEYRTPQLTARRRGRFDVVVCLRTDNTVLYDRLQARGYAQNKITENVTCEIMQECLQDTREFYKDEITLALQSDTEAQQQANAESVVQRIQQWAGPGAAAGGGAAAAAAAGGGGGAGAGGGAAGGGARGGGRFQPY